MFHVTEPASYDRFMFLFGSVSFKADFHEVRRLDGIGLGCRDWVKLITFKKEFPEAGV